MTEQTISPAGARFVASREGVVLKAYRDPTGTWTIGAGHTAAAGAPVPVSGMTITADQAYALLAADLAKIYEPKLRSLVKVPLLQHEFDALDSFIFNVGGGNLASSTLLRKLNAGDKAGAAEHFADWTKSKGVTLPGLVSRREAERTIFLTGVYPGVPAGTAVSDTPTKDQPMIAKGATGMDVKTLQMQLTAAGYPTTIDGDFGQETDNAVRAFQASKSLPVDGIVGLKTWLALDKAEAASVPAMAAAPAVQPPGPIHSDNLPAARPSLLSRVWAKITGKAA